MGYVMPCLFASLRFGNILEDPIEETRYNMIVKTRDLRDPEKLKGKCRSCNYRSICGGCKVRSYELGGDWFGEDPLCSYNPEESTSSG
ncbi:MAG: SPASM domain-containing protein [Candidatus Methanomethylicia archaeon]